MTDKTPETRFKLLESVNYPEDLRTLPEESLPILAHEIREFMIESVSKTGGHLSSSLGAVELAVAIHYVFNTPEDAVVWDVGHQAYAHKILTGRREAMAGTAMCQRSVFPARLSATAIPSAAEIDVEECAVPKLSYGLSLRLGKPEMPPQ